MQRLQAVQQGGPMQLASVPIPEPEATEVCIKLHAIGLNPLDYKQLYNGELVRGWPASFGIDGAGVVTAVGGEVTQFKVGDRVMSLFGHGDRAAAFQEVAVVPEWHVAKLPQALSFEEGASLP
jgi:NADPH:quinone reductase-like Zn-dependent oxidoreductase